MTDAVAPEGVRSHAAHWQTYTSVAIALHWLIALAIFGLMASGIWMTDAIHVEATQATAIDVYQVHKSFGLSVLVLSALRLVWRVLHPAPQMPEGMTPMERRIAHLTHVAFYVLMIGIPLTGWAMVSVSPQSVPTFYFWLFEVPHWPFLATVAAETKPMVEAVFANAHAILAYGALVLIILHVGAALKHHFVNRDAVLARMTPGVSPRGPVSEPPQGSRLSFAPWRVAAASAVVAICGGAAWALSTIEAPTSAPTGQEVAEVSLETDGGATLWGPVLEESAIVFTGTNAGASFEGRFSSWKALISFDPDKLNVSEIVVIIDVDSASTGDAMNDTSMLGADWFDAASYPKASYVAEVFEPGAAPGEFIAKGFLSIRDIELPVDLPFTLTIDGDRAEASGSLILDRTAFGVGVGPDPNAMFVSKEIPVEITVVALRAE